MLLESTCQVVQQESTKESEKANVVITPHILKFLDKSQ